MKKFLAMLLLCALTVGGITAVYAQSVQSAKAQLRADFDIVIDNTECRFENANGETVYPIFYYDSTYLPVRAIGEIMGKTVNWDEPNKTVTLSGNKSGVVKAASDNSSAQKQNIDIEVRPDFKIVIDDTARSFYDANGEVVYPILYDGSVYLPIRAIGEIMGKDVSWNNGTKTVTLSGGSGTVTDADSFNTTTTNGAVNTQPASGDIGLDRAKAIAAEHAGVSVNQITFTKAKTDYDDGRKEYELEFIYNSKEYDYEIDAATGNILSYDIDGKTVKNVNNGGTNYISSDKAAEIVLKKVPGATSANLSIKLDTDDGKAVYEGKIVYNGMEYEFEVDAVSGNVIDWDIDD